MGRRRHAHRDPKLPELLDHGIRQSRATAADPSMKHRSAPKEKCPYCLSLWGPLGGHFFNHKQAIPGHPRKPPREQTFRSPRPEVTSVLARSWQSANSATAVSPAGWQAGRLADRQKVSRFWTAGFKP